MLLVIIVISAQIKANSAEYTISNKVSPITLESVLIYAL